jgi:hypothetical protein
MTRRELRLVSKIDRQHEAVTVPAHFELPGCLQTRRTRRRMDMSLRTRQLHHDMLANLREVETHTATNTHTRTVSIAVVEQRPSQKSTPRCRRRLRKPCVHHRQLNLQWQPFAKDATHRNSVTERRGALTLTLSSFRISARQFDGPEESCMPAISVSPRILAL